MFDLNCIVTSELTTDFIADGDNYIAVDLINRKRKGEIIVNGCTFNASSDDIFIQYKLWLTRPERSVGKKVDLDQPLEDLADIYEEILTGAYLMQWKTSFEFFKSTMTQTLDWLRTTDFFYAPASSQYHESFKGGLLIHSLRVYNSMIDLLKTDAFKNVSISDATIACLVHDWCKIGFYESYYRNVKNEETGSWDKVLSYKRNPRGITLGHGVTSMYLASKCFNLNSELAAAIRWHMGEYNVAHNEMDELHKANATYPLCYLVQFADRLACVAWNDQEGA